MTVTFTVDNNEEFNGVVILLEINVGPYQV